MKFFSGITCRMSSMSVRSGDVVSHEVPIHEIKPQQASQRNRSQAFLPPCDGHPMITPMGKKPASPYYSYSFKPKYLIRQRSPAATGSAEICAKFRVFEWTGLRRSDIQIVPVLRGDSDRTGIADLRVSADPDRVHVCSQSLW